MKSKKNIYFLLPAVLIVWGLLGYRIYTSLAPTNSIEQNNVSTTQFIPQEIAATETFTINTDYRDPFLGEVSKRPKVVPKKSNKQATTVPQKPFPTIVYKGVVAAEGKKEQVFIISIDDQQHFFKKNTTKNDVKLVRGTSSEIILQFQGEKKSFTLTK